MIRIPKLDVVGSSPTEECNCFHRSSVQTRSWLSSMFASTLDKSHKPNQPFNSSPKFIRHIRRNTMVCGMLVDRVELRLRLGEPSGQAFMPTTSTESNEDTPHTTYV